MKISIVSTYEDGRTETSVHEITSDKYVIIETSVNNNAIRTMIRKARKSDL